ncbi:GYD domain-containing protein [Aggregatilinea lenta]|uniref:GYD domain-containing protein n=1 Tax=Aggregatilinea lenta TaxID=913108 RepID=UPI000E5A2D3C|nr:GYD domain-containing protein [Aggregatilinea lenta]
MPIYILLSMLTSEGATCVAEDPSCLRDTSMDIENLGVKVLDQYATLGQYDFVHIIEAPDNETIARVSMELVSHGHLKPLSLPAISINDFISRMSLDRRP